ncbi:MAG: carboxylesterase family protein [Azoarcus sp.]|jgi:para-nitrobenzyl esterase|nr:carboxylesterase family protein [Azoarcus sp.]
MMKMENIDGLINERKLSRRNFSKLLGLAPMASLAGCMGGGGGDSDDAPPANGGYAVSPEAKVMITGGEIQGTNLSSGVRSFLGVPFAAPPVGSLRWKAPQAVVPWSGTKLTQSNPPAAIYRAAPVTLDGMSTPWTSSEDALYLNMWVPREAMASVGGLPVLFCLHGNNNNASQARYAGAELARKGLIVIRPQFRQGIFGCLPLDELSAEPENKGTSGKFNVLDVIAGLQWVQDNIAKFGGDPENVTLGYQSVGAYSIIRLQTSPVTKGLFHKIFTETGGLNAVNTYAAESSAPLATAEVAGAAWMAQFGTIAGTTAASSVADLRAKAPAELFLVPTTRDVTSGIGTDYLFPKTVSSTFLAGEQHDVPMFVGNCREEAFNAGVSGVTDLATYQAALSAKYASDASTVFNFYPAFNDADAVKMALRLNSDYEWKCNVEWARLQKTHGKSPVYLYLFYRGHTATAGATHGSAVSYWFGNLTSAYSDNTYPYTTPADYELSDRMMESLTAFCKTGNPGTANLAVPEYDQGDEWHVGFDVGSISTMKISPAVDWLIKNSDKY